MKYISIEDFIKQHLRYKQHWNKKIILSTDAVWQKLTEPVWIDGVSFAAGSTFKVFETTNFGWVVFDQQSKTIEGKEPIRRIFKW